MKCPEDFFTSPNESTIIDEVKEQIASEDLIDQDQLRAMQDWSYLAHKVVGAEE